MLFRLIGAGNEQFVRLADTEIETGRVPAMDIEYVPLDADIADKCELPVSWIVAPRMGALVGPVTVPEIKIVPVAAEDDWPIDSWGEEQAVSEQKAAREQMVKDCLFAFSPVFIVATTLAFHGGVIKITFC
jgi:hypothetical protein